MNSNDPRVSEAGPACAGPRNPRCSRLILGLVAAAFGAALASPAAALNQYANGKIVFAGKADGDLEIHKLNADGSGRTQLTFNGGKDTSPAWSPDGKRIAYASNRDGSWDVYVMTRDGSSLLNVTGDSPAAETSPAWSLDGRKLAFVSTRAGGKQIFVQDLVGLADGTPPVQVTSTGNNVDPSWGIVNTIERIFFTSSRDGDDEIYSVMPTGLGLLQLTSNGVADQHPRFSRSGQVFWQRREATGFQVWRMNANGTSPQAVPLGVAQATMPAGSPDGERVVFVGGKGRKSEIYVADVDGGNVLRLTNDQAVDELPDWQTVQTPSIQLPEIYDVVVVPRGLEIEVSFKTRKVVTTPIVELFRGAALDSFQVGSGSGKTWTLVVGALDVATEYDLEIAVATAPGKYVYYEHATPVKTLRRKVTFIARYAYMLEDSDPESCGDVVLDMQLGYEQIGTGIAVGQENACTGYIWNFPNRSMTVDDVDGDTLTIRFDASDDDTPWDSSESANAYVTVDLIDYPESFTKTRIAKLEPYGDSDLFMDVTFDYRVEYH